MSGEVTSSPFKMVVFFLFFFFGALGVVMFALYQANAGKSELSDVTMWGTIPQAQFDAFLTELNNTVDARASKIKYTYIPEESFNDRLIQALAYGEGPGIVILNDEQILRFRDMVYVRPYESFDIASFKNTYIDAANVLLTPQGIVGMPMAVDPLVLYWNRSIFANNHYTMPPKQWPEIYKMARKMTVRNDAGDIQLSAIALGEYDNVLHAKDIYTAMLMQAGGNMLARGSGGGMTGGLMTKSQTGTLPARDALVYYTQFSNPAKDTYSWSKAQPLDREAFIAGDVAMYIGYASELPLILAKNPNLSFGVAPLPQLTGDVGQRTSTMARVYAIAIPKVAYDPRAASILTGMLTTRTAAEAFERSIALPSPRRDLLAIEPDDELKTTFRNAAIIARTWLDPDPDATSAIVRKMINSVVSGKKKVVEAIQRANAELSALVGR